MNNRIANDLIRYAELVEDSALISPEEMNCASVMRLAAEYLAQPEQEKERCVGCEACIDTACGRDECPKGWPKAPLTGEQIINEADRFDWDKDCAVRFARAIEAAHGITASEAEDSQQRSKT